MKKIIGAQESILRLFLLLSISSLFTGCAMVNVASIKPNEKITARVVIPAWPWQDSRQVVDRLSLSVSTNRLTYGLRAEQAETTSTNFANILEGVVGAAVKAAVTAAK